MKALKKVMKWGGIAALGVGSLSVGAAHRSMGRMEKEITSFSKAVQRWIATRMDLSDFEQMWATSGLTVGSQRDGMDLASLTAANEMYGPEAGD